jgi:hypothetical protein
VSTRDTRSIYQATRDSPCNDVSTRDAQCLLRLLIPILNIIWDKRNAFNHLFVKSWGSQRVLLETMTLVTTDFISQYKIRESILK